MKFWIIIITAFSAAACKSTEVTQSGADAIANKKAEKRDIDSLYIVYSLPIFVSHTNNFHQIAIQDSLVALLKNKKYDHLDDAGFKQLFSTKQMEILPRNNSGQLKEATKKVKNEEDYFRLMESQSPYLQLIQLSFLKHDSGLNYINVRRLNMPNAKKSRNWTFTYPDSEPSGQVASRLLDSLINTKRTQ